MKTCFLITTFLSGGLVSAIELNNADTEVDTVVIDTTYGVQLTQAAAPIPFKNFRYPFLDESENVTFIGNDPYLYGQAKQGNGIYRSYADGRIESLVSQDDPSPDDGKPIGAIMGLRTDFKSFVFHRGYDAGTGIYGSFDGGPLVTVASRSTKAPGYSTNFDWVWYADVCEDLVVFNGTPKAEPDWINGLYLYRHSSGQTTRLLDTTQTVSVVGNSRLGNLSYQPRIDATWLVFSASRQGDGDGKIPPKKGIFGWPVTDGGNLDGMFALDRLQVLAPVGMEIPESGGLPLTSASNPMTSNGLMAVVAGSHALGEDEELPKWQAICIRTTDGVWHNPVDTNTVNPILKDGSYFTGFSKWVGMQDGKVIFLADGPNNYQAVYIYDVASDSLYFIADTNVRIGDKKVVSFEHSGHPLVGKRLALMIRFSDASSGEYLATLPKLPTKAFRKKASVPAITEH